MSKTISLFILIVFYLISCLSFKTLNSTTYIKPNDAFILGNNEHGKFYANVINTSNKDIKIWQCPIIGGEHSPIVLKGLSKAKVVVEKNTYLRLENMSSEEVAVKLKVKGDLGLSMGYNN